MEISYTYETKIASVETLRDTPEEKIIKIIGGPFTIELLNPALDVSVGDKLEVISKKEMHF